MDNSICPLGWRWRVEREREDKGWHGMAEENDLRIK